MINKHSNIVKNCVSAAGKVVGLFACFAEMCDNTISVAKHPQIYSVTKSVI